MRPIDADVFAGGLMKIADRAEKLERKEIAYVIYDVVTPVLINTPTVDAQPVVRCKDCKYLRIDEDFVTGRYCALRNVNGGRFCKDDDFCSYGRRKENDIRYGDYDCGCDSNEDIEPII